MKNYVEMTEKLQFTKISVEDRQWMTRRMEEEQPEACEYTFVNNFIWRRAYDVEVAQVKGCGLIRYRDFNGYCYSYPFGGGDKRAVIELLLNHCREEGRKLHFCPLTDRYRQELLKWFPGQFEICSDRDDFDYVYLREDLASLKGKRYHGKRNHIARFKDGEDWNYEPLTVENLEECRRMQREWLTYKEDKLSEGVDEEAAALEEAFTHFEEFHLVGGLVRKGGRVVAFTVAEPLNEETMVIHFEKAYPDLQGAYPMINQQFILHECENYKYINREEDVGDMGLRKAKLSYYPEILLKKYCAAESAVVFASEYDLDQIRHIWRTCFGDGEDYIDLYLKNRFDPENMMVIYRDGRPVSMASFLPARLKRGEDWLPVRYVYAVATLPEYRRLGLASEILQHALEKYGEPLILQPETEELEGYYERLGFEKGFAEENWEFRPEAGAGPDLPGGRGELRAAGIAPFKAGESDESPENEAGKEGISEISPEEYKEIRDKHFDGDGYVRWDEQGIAYALEENRFCGGRALKAGQDMILYRREKDALRVLETTLEGEALQSRIRGLLAAEHMERAVYENRAGMIRYPADRKDMAGESNYGYLNLTLG